MYELADTRLLHDLRTAVSAKRTEAVIAVDDWCVLHLGIGNDKVPICNKIIQNLVVAWLCFMVASRQESEDRSLINRISRSTPDDIELVVEWRCTLVYASCRRLRVFKMDAGQQAQFCVVTA